MLVLYIAIAAAIIFVILLVVVFINALQPTGSTYESRRKRAGRYAEELVANTLRESLKEDDHLFTNIEIEFDGRPAELDAVVVNKCGVFIFEVKNYKGELHGAEDDYEWYKEKRTNEENIYAKMVKNPIKQVKRQVYLLANYLDYCGKKVWVDGYAILLQGNSPVESDMVISSIDEFNNVIHTHRKNSLAQKDVEDILNILK